MDLGSDRGGVREISYVGEVSANVDEALEANSHHITTIATSRLPATDATAEYRSRAVATLAIVV